MKKKFLTNFVFLLITNISENPLPSIHQHTQTMRGAGGAAEILTLRILRTLRTLYTHRNGNTCEVCEV